VSVTIDSAKLPLRCNPSRTFSARGHVFDCIVTQNQHELLNPIPIAFDFEAFDQALLKISTDQEWICVPTSLVCNIA
jgi:hypothetical protein